MCSRVIFEDIKICVISAENCNNCLTYYNTWKWLNLMWKSLNTGLKKLDA